MTVNLVAELVQLFGPVLYARNPIRQVNPREVPTIPIEVFGNPQDPNVQLQYAMLMQQAQPFAARDAGRAKLLEWYLNYTPNALDLKTHSRNAIDECLIKGMGVLWTELWQPRGAPWKVVGSFYDSCDNLLVDPDNESIMGAGWVGRYCVHPTWWLEREYGLRPGSLTGNMESYGQQSMVQTDPDGDYHRRQGLTNDLIGYWKIYSKIGMGARMSGVTKEYPGFTPELRTEMEKYGDYCFLVVADSVPDRFLNIPPELVEQGMQQEISRRVQWPTPFWADDEWPFTYLSFHDVPREVYPMAHIKPALGELKFINWVYSFIACKIKTSSRDLIVCRKSLGEEIKNTLLRGSDFELIEIDRAHGTIKEVVQILQHPQMNGDIFKVVEAVTENFRKRTGLTELMYGETAHQYRSAQEADLKADQLHIRPDDMKNKVEDWMSDVARKEAFAARWHLTQDDVAPMMGPIGAQFWAQLVMPADPNEILHQLEYRIEAGSAAKPNKQRDQQNYQQALQALGPILQQYAFSTGDVQPLNALISGWAKGIDLDPTNLLLKPPAPPVPPAGAGPAPAPAGNQYGPPK